MVSIIRKVEPGDREGIVSIIEGCENLTSEEKDCAIELIDIYLNEPAQDDYLLLLAADGKGAPLGYVCYGTAALASGVYDIYWILVDRENRGRGVGRTLLEHTEAEVKSQGARMLIAETSSLPGYDLARSFYLNNGFSEEARIRGFFKPGDDKVIFVKNL